MLLRLGGLDGGEPGVAKPQPREEVVQEYFAILPFTGDGEGPDVRNAMSAVLVVAPSSHCSAHQCPLRAAVSSHVTCVRQTVAP